MGSRIRLFYQKEEKNEAIIDIWVLMLISYAFVGSLWILTTVGINPMFVEKMSYLVLIGLSGLTLGIFFSPMIGRTRFLIWESGFYGEKGIGREEIIFITALLSSVIIQIIVFFKYGTVIIASTYSEMFQKIIFYTSASVYEELLFTYWLYRLLSSFERPVTPLKIPIASIIAVSVIFAMFHSVVYAGQANVFWILFLLRAIYCIAFELTRRLSVPMFLHFIQNLSPA
jgi:membrane protease YdiL (CAAX protease family)